jgi:hypothetical protein
LNVGVGDLFAVRDGGEPDFAVGFDGRQLNRLVGPVRNAGAKTGLTRSQAEAAFRSLQDEEGRAPRPVRGAVVPTVDDVTDSLRKKLRLRAGLAAQHADAAAGAIVAFLGVDAPAPFRPLLRARLLDPRGGSRHPGRASRRPPLRAAVVAADQGRRAASRRLPEHQPRRSRAPAEEIDVGVLLLELAARRAAGGEHELARRCRDAGRRLGEGRRSARPGAEDGRHVERRDDALGPARRLTDDDEMAHVVLGHQLGRAR